jgi:hypothetical protein
MKLKVTILSALFAAGVFASFALAEGGKHVTKADNNNCQEVHISGTIAPQTLAVTVGKASKNSLIPAGTQLSLAVGAAGQTVNLKAEACATGTGTALVLTVKQVQLKPVKVKTTTGATQTGTNLTATTSKKHDEHENKGGTTTTATTTAATTTSTP